MKNLTLLILKTYKRYISSQAAWLFGDACRFSPTCSNYAYEAIERYGLLKGGRLALKRLVRCHPFQKGGTDLVPESLN